MECMAALFICHCSPSWLFTKGRVFYFSLGPKTASGAYWHKSILSQHHLKNWSGKSALTFMSGSPQYLLQESQTVQPSVSLLFAVFFCVLFPRQNGCGFRFYRKCSAYPFFGGAMGHNSTRTCVRSVLVAVHKHRIVLPMCET